MAGGEDLALMAHLMRRAGFGANRDELEDRTAQGYAATVEELLNPENQPPFDDDLAYRYIPYYRMGTGVPSYQTYWMYRMVATQRPLEEKMTLFWHHIFATSHSKMNRNPQMNQQLQLFRGFALGNFRTILVELSKDPAMIYWLDNNENHNGAPNENYGRELLELFSMGVGKDMEFNYSEDDVKECARAFTGWTMAPQLPRYPYGDYCWQFEYRSDDHDHGEKTFLGERGRFNGEDIVDIIVRQPSTARFLARHLYNFFVADEPQVPAWQTTEPQDPEAVKILEDEYFRSNGDVRSMLRVLFNSDFFKEARFTKVKNPTEVVVSTLRMVGGAELPSLDVYDYCNQITYMGQDLLNPPSVEGWHYGAEWINSSSLMKRANFVADMVSQVDRPGVREILERVKLSGGSPESAVDTCIDLLGPVEVNDETRTELIDHAHVLGEFAWDEENEAKSAQRVAELLQLIVATREYQFA